MDPAKVTQLLKAEKDWGRISKQLTLYTHKRLGRSYERAREISQDAIAQVWDPKYIGWDPDRHTLMQHLIRAVNSLVVNERRLHKKKERPTIDDELAELHYHEDSPSELHDEKEKREQAYDRLAQAVAGDEIASSALELIQTGIDTPAAVAESLQLDIARVRNAWRRIAAHSEKIAREMEE